ncbi:MAG: class I SAM-dependent methyltransferase [Pseudomonadota bacterium]|nr:class I SAM-dependent methyltransferase [Pseudomonadota bacterium]
MNTKDIENSLYSHYHHFKSYSVPQLKKKHIKQFDREFWGPTASNNKLKILEVGCGTGLFLQYLHHKGTTDLTGVDRDPILENFIHPDVKSCFIASDIFEFLRNRSSPLAFDRIAMFDVLEHFELEEGIELLQLLSKFLSKSGRIVIRVPNTASPWGIQFQFGDLTHRTAYTPSSLKQLAIMSDLECIKCLPQIRGSNSKRVFQRILNYVLEKSLPETPEIWSANFIAILQHRNAFASK